MSDDVFDPVEEESKGKWPHVVIYLIYILAVGFAEVMFIGMMQNIFVEFHPFLMFFAAAGAVAAGLTVAVMPWVKKNWMATSEMNSVSWIFWTLELLVLTLNTILAFDVANQVADSWVGWWRHISPASPILAVLTWGILMQMHPAFKKSQGRLKFFGKVDTLLETKLMKRLNSSEVDERLQANADALVDQFMERKFGMMLDTSRGRGLPAPKRIINHEPVPPVPAGRKRFRIFDHLRNGNGASPGEANEVENGADPTRR